MHIFHFFQSLFIPTLPGNIGIFFLPHHRLCRQQTAVFIVYGNAAQILPVGRVQKIHPLLNLLILSGKVIFLNHIIINGIRHSPHANQIILQVFPRLPNQLLGAGNKFLPG